MLSIFSFYLCQLFSLCDAKCPFFVSGNPPVLLLPDNVRIRRYNLSSKQYSDYVDNAEHIQALDYIWDPEDQGLSKTITHNLETTAKQYSALRNVFISVYLILVV